MGRLAGLPPRAHFLSYHHHYQAPRTLHNTLRSTTAPATATQPLLIIHVNQILLMQHLSNPKFPNVKLVLELFPCLCHSGRVTAPAAVTRANSIACFGSLGPVHTNTDTVEDVFYVCIFRLFSRSPKQLNNRQISSASTSIWYKHGRSLFLVSQHDEALFCLLRLAL